MKVEDTTLRVLRLAKRDAAKKKIAEEQQRWLRTDREDAAAPEGGSEETNAAVLKEEAQTDQEPVFNVTCFLQLPLYKVCAVPDNGDLDIDQRWDSNEKPPTDDVSICYPNLVHSAQLV